MRVPHPNVVLFDVRVGILTLKLPYPREGRGIEALIHPSQPDCQ
jgi:hypothetical protein